MDASDQNVYEYLKVVAARKDDTLEQLYANAGACRCIFESLPELAKQYVMRLVPCGDLWVELDKWLAEGASFDQHRVACQRLSELRVMEKRQQLGAGEEYRLHEGFRGQMLEWLCGSEQGRWKGGDSKSSKDEGTTVEMMHAKASLKWEKVLQFMLSGKFSLPQSGPCACDGRANRSPSTQLHVTEWASLFLTDCLRRQGASRRPLRSWTCCVG